MKKHKNYFRPHDSVCLDTKILRVRLLNVIIVEMERFCIAYSFVKQVEIPETWVRLHIQGRGIMRAKGH